MAYKNCYVWMAPRQSWDKTMIAEGLRDIPDGTLLDATPEPGRTFTRHTYPPRGRGRGESLTSPRRLHAKQRTIEALKLRQAGESFETIARKLGYKGASGPWHALNRMMSRLQWDERRRETLKKEKRMYGNYD